MIMELQELCCYYVALLRCVGLVHQNSHWLTKGKNFYGNHLLFERIYNSALKDMDGAAEKLIGLFSDEVLDLDMQAEMIGKTLKEFAKENPVETSLAIEKEFLEFSQKFYDTLKKEDKLSLGLDDFLMATASSREEAVYLLQQIQKEGKMASRVKERMAALKALAQMAAPGAEPVLPPGEGPEQQKEKAAIAKLREDLSSQFAIVLSGRMPSFNLRVQRIAANRFNAYNIAIVIPKALAKFQKTLEDTAKRVVYQSPYWEGTAQQVNVVLA
jgi:DNA-binding ferritin-like protein